jgi:predicted phage terminase large subunit-like protein
MQTQGNLALSQDRIKKLRLLRRLKARQNHLDFMSYTWTNQTTPFLTGYHTKVICDCIDTAIEKFRRGISTYWVIAVPFRHGKSEIISRKLPAHFLGLFPDNKVILCGHTAELTEGFSKTSKNILSLPQYHDLFPGVIVDPASSSGAHWRIHKREGECFASGLLGSLSGQGYHLGLLDDFCRNRADAESETMREKMWNAFTNDFMTRGAETSITMVVATTWHVDDIIGRIAESQKHDPDFPKFKVIRLPALSDKYPSGTLFPEKFSKKWYIQRKAILGEYGFSSLMQLEPVKRGGNMLNTECIQKHKSISEYPKNLKWYRIWDLAHTAKERAKQDPDWTSGTLFAMNIMDDMPHIWLKNVNRMRKNAPERDTEINMVARLDGSYVKIGIGGSVDSKDAIKTMQKILKGKRTVISVPENKDKVVRATPLEPIFKAGNVHVPANAPWLPDWLSEIAAFPFGAHDDQVDNLSSGYAVASGTGDNSALYDF